MRRNTNSRNRGSSFTRRTGKSKRWTVAQKDSQRLVRAVCEAMEDRTLLSATLRGLIPSTITPSSVTQTLLAPGNISATLTPASTTTAVSSSYRFVLNNATAGELTQFSTAESSSGSATDSAIALYDASGNLLTIQDADASAPLANESLSTGLVSGQQYEVAFYAMKLTASTPQAITLNLNPGPQAEGSSITLNPSFGTGTLTTSASPNAFSSSTSVRYFPINFLDAGTSASISLSAAGPDTSVSATLYQLPRFTLGGFGATPTWQFVSSTTTTAGGSGTLGVTPPSGQNVTDGNYVLVVAPLNFSAAAEPLTITASTTSLLTPPAANTSTVVGPVPQSLTAIGTVGGTINSNITSSAAKLYSVTAAISGTMSVSYQAAASNGLVSVYGPGGTSLVAVGTTTGSGSTASTSFPASAGTTYYLLVGPDAQAGVNDTFTLTTSQSYAPTAVSATSTLGQTTGLNLAASAGASFFRVSASGGSNVLAMQVAPASGSNLVVQATVIGPSQSVQTFTASGAGQPVQIVINELGNPGPYDVLLTSTSGTGTATFKYITLTIPQQIAINQLPNQTMNLALGGVTTSTLPVTNGVLAGVQYYQPTVSSGTSTYTSQTAGGATAILLHYVQNGGVLALEESAAPNSSGFASVTDSAAGNVLHAIAAMPVNFSGGGTVQLTVSGPLPSGIGLGFIPNALPNQTEPQGFQYQSSIQLTGVQLATQQEIDLYTTTLPANITSTSTSLTFTPVDIGGPLHVTVSVLSGTNALIASATNSPGQPVTVPLSSVTPNETLRFEVTPVAGSNLGSGKYGLSMVVNTGNPLPYLVTQGSFMPFTTAQSAGINYFPNAPITQLNFNQTYTENFTSSAPYNPNGTGSIQVYEFNENIPYRQGFQITTTDVDPTVNTNFALFYQDTTSSTPTKYIPLPGTSVNFDYYPGDRSSVDARIVDINVDDTPFLTLGEFDWVTVPVYVVVMNEQGSLGQYNISATPAPTPALIGPGSGVPAKVLSFAPSSGLADLNPASYAVTATSNSQIFAIRAPVDVGNGAATLTVSGGASGQTFTAVISTPPHGIIPGQAIDVGTGTFNSAGTATVVLGNASVGLPIAPLGSQGSYNISVGVTSGTFPAGGLTLSNLTIGRAAVSPIASSSPTNYPLDAGFNGAISRIDQAPDGTFTDTLGISGTSVTADFSVTTAGPVVIHMSFPSSAVSPTLGLYQSGQHATVVNQFTTTYSTSGILLDSQNTRDSNGLFTINANLLPGTYFVVGASSTSFSRFNPGTASFTGTIPSYQATVLNVNPTTGSNTVAEESTVNINTSDSGGSASNDPQFYDYRYNSTYYAFTVPANTNGSPVSVLIADTPNNLTPATEHGYGNINLFLWKKVNGIWTNVGFAVWAIQNSNPYVDIFSLTATDSPHAGDVYYVGVDMNGYEIPAYLGVTVPILTSGLPDYSVQPVVLSADSGKTRITSSIINESFTAAPASTFALQTGGTTASRFFFPLAPFASYQISQDYVPGSINDVVSVTADPNNTVQELSDTNNYQQAKLSDVDPFAPTATFRLTDTAMTAESTGAASTGGGTWGRYISGVSGQKVTIELNASDTGLDLYQVSIVGPPDANTPAWVYNVQTFNTTSPSAVTLDVTGDFGDLPATSASNPNNIKFMAIDKFGVPAPLSPQHLDVISPPSYLTGGIPPAGTAGAGGSIKFTLSSHSFAYTFKDAMINYANTIDGLLNSDLPVVGQEPVSLLVAINASGTSGLDPTQGIPFTVSGQLTISAMNQKLLDKSYSAANAGDHFSFNAQMILNGATLLPGSASVSMQLSKLQLFQISTPLIPLASIGIPDVASVSIGLKYSLGATLSAGAKLGTNPADLTSASQYLDALGIMSPTFVEPSLTGSATVSGQVSVAGFDIASLSGSVGLSINVAIGLDNSNPDAIFAPSDAIHNLGIDVDATLNVKLAASIKWIGDIWSYNYNEDLGNIVNTLQHGMFLTDPPSTAAGNFLAPGSAPGVIPNTLPGPVFVSGTSLDAGYTIDPSPQLVIDNSVANGLGLSAQLVNVGTTTAPVANLSVATRTAGSWSAATTLNEGNDVSDPQLALTHSSSFPGLLVYAVDKVAGSPTGQTINSRLDNEEIAFRYFNGTSWSTESAITNDGLYDSEPHIAVNASGVGTLAYVHNTDSVPMDGSANLDANANDVEVSTYNAATHSFTAPVVLGTAGDGVSDSSPAAFVDASGNQYVVWIRGTGATSQLMYSVNNGTGWSAPAALQLAGLATGGTFNNVALGSDGSGRIDVVFSYSVTNADGTVTTTLFNRPTATSAFTSSAPITQLAANEDFSGLRTSNASTGAMVVYWQQSDGQTSEVEEATVLNGIESGPFQVSDTSNLATSPSLAVDNSGKLQVLYDDTIPYGGSAQTQKITDPGITGLGLASGVLSSNVNPSLPQLTFLTGLQFPTLSGGVAPTGSTVTGNAVISNRGQVATSVTIQGYDGIAGQPGAAAVGTPQTINLSPGASYNVSYPFTVLNGTNAYSLQVTSPLGEAYDTVETISSAMFTGGLDLQAVSLTNDVNSPTPGTAQTLFADVYNRSTVTTGPFDVTIYQGDPLKSESTAVALSTQTINSLAGLTHTFLQFQVTLPSGSSDDVYTVMVDSANTIAETDESNNYARYELDYRSDPAIVTNPASGVVGITATQVNTGNSNNVQVTVNVSNLGAGTLTNVPVDLNYTRNGGPLTSLGQMVIATLAPGAIATEVFTVTALAGDDVFVASIDSTALAQDINPNNDVGTSEITVSGLPTLGATLSLSRPASIAGTALTLNATVNNTGLADGTSVPLVVLASLTSGGPSTVIGSGSVSVVGLSSQLAQIALDTSGLAPGLYTITLEIDPNQTVLQGSDAGNVVTTTEILLVPNSDVINGTSSIDGITLVQDPDGTHIDWTLNGASGGQMAINDPAGLTINGNGLNDVVTFSYGSTGTANPLPNKLNLNGIFTFNGLSTTGNPLAGTTMDIGQSTLFISYATPANDPIAMIQGYLRNGFGSGTWNGTSTAGVIRSSAAAANTNLYSVGYADSADAGNPAGIPTANTIEIRFTSAGDANLNGTVDINDYNAVVRNFGVGTRWDQGDVTYGSAVSINDYNAVVRHFGQSAPMLSAPPVFSNTVVSQPSASSDSASQLSGLLQGSSAALASSTLTIPTWTIPDNTKKIKTASKLKGRTTFSVKPTTRSAGI